MHFHREMEIVSIILAGEITHEDSEGNNSVLSQGQIQHMSAGSGIRHAEFNHGKTDLEIYQIWFLPNQKNLKPSYVNKSLGDMSFKNKLTSIVSPTGSGNSLRINADAEILLGNLEAGASVSRPLDDDHGLFVYLRSGAVKINEELLSAGDQARIIGMSSVEIEATSDAILTVIDVAL